MDMRAAAKATLALAHEHGMNMVESDNPDLDYPHLLHMCELMHTEQFSEGKLGRWLGWMQAAVVAADVGISLNDMKNLNQSFSEGSN